MGSTRYIPRVAKAAGAKRRLDDIVEPRFVRIGTRRTALRLEPIFWAALQEIADARGQAVEELLRDIVPPPPPRNLTSRVRVAILAQYWSADDNPRFA
ncbi:MAG: ribbon-helix-helix domain-containing protein [Alphaproteobacteria bacterium]|nr:ribbon-helix-helix domain-containing protein [Alphaproteobacteria bacterium]MBN9496861.1 ribbon-helix-helix domain-containing protein [Alphaproteobacteria bacterium]